MFRMYIVAMVLCLLGACQKAEQCKTCTLPCQQCTVRKMELDDQGTPYYPAITYNTNDCGSGAYLADIYARLDSAYPESGFSVSCVYDTPQEKEVCHKEASDLEAEVAQLTASGYTCK